MLQQRVQSKDTCNLDNRTFNCRVIVAVTFYVFNKYMSEKHLIVETVKLLRQCSIDVALPGLLIAKSVLLFVKSVLLGTMSVFLLLHVLAAAWAMFGLARRGRGYFACCFSFAVCIF